jgi:undecaprenyl-diphosphatase
LSLVQAIVLGVVQGLTEFLPISSSGHLRIVPAFAGWDDPGAAFTAVIQLGTMAAVLLYFRADLIRIATAWFRSLRDPARRGTLDARLGWYLLLSTIPISLIGGAFKKQIEKGARDL